MSGTAKTNPPFVAKSLRAERKTITELWHLLYEKSHCIQWLNSVSIRNPGAGDAIRTHDPHLGKVMLYP
jgi:hypothetical protein